MSEEANENLAKAQAFMELSGRYIAGAIDASSFAKGLPDFMAHDVVFWSNYTPTWEPMRPLFESRVGLDGVLARYAYEAKHEKVGGETEVTDFVLVGDALYVTIREVASFFDRAPVTWGMVVKMKFNDGKIVRIEMYLDSRPIEAAYSAHMVANE